MDAFREVGIYARKDFIKFLFVSPYGAYGKTLRVILPAQGVEDISYFLLRGGDNIDSIVYNIHLGSREGYRSLLSHTGFDVIGFSPVVIDNDVELMVDASRLSPRSLKIMGGVIVRHAPVEELLRAFPVDVVAYGRASLFAAISPIYCLLAAVCQV